MQRLYQPTEFFCDVSKAFDVFNYDALLYKLNSYDVRGVANQWFQSYLIDRSQFVELEKVDSSLLPVGCGVPLLYLIYVNDIYNLCNGNIASFADDITLFVSHYDVHQLFSNANMHKTIFKNGFVLTNCH